MKQLSKSLATIFALALIVLVVWFVGNYMALLPEKYPLLAASSVAGRHLQRESVEKPKAVSSGNRPVFPFGAIHSFDIRENDKVVAKVELYDFVGLGWQEESI